MYRKILVALENGSADETLVPHVTELARLLGSELLLLHVADGFAARNFNQLKLAESDEIKADRAYLESVAKKMHGQNIKASTHLAFGNPPQEILKVIEAEDCDLVAMGSHGHRLLGDIIHGSTIYEVRHKVSIPVLLVREKKQPPPP
jgi:nucleotide-binding universal stress UspA family protein